MENKPLGRKLLVIDKDETILKEVETVLLKEGYTVHIAANLNTSIEIINSNEIDMVLLDIHSLMKKGIDGYEELKEKFPELPIVVTSHNI